MKRSALVLSLCAMLLVACAPIAHAQELRLVQTIALPDVEGRMDHMAADAPGRRLFIAALGNNSLEVVDLRAGVRIHRITGLHEPQGVGYAPGPHRLFVANGRGGALNIYDARNYQQRGSIGLSDDADNVRYDPKADRIYVGYGDGALEAVNGTSGKEMGSMRVGGHPEAFQLERNGARIFVNVPTADQIAVVDRARQRVIATWPVAGARANFPMALDEAHHRLFVGCRQPARLLVYDTATGHEVASVSIDGDTDDVFYDPARSRLYVSCGAGFLDIIEQKSASSYAISARLPTASGARTSLYVPELGRLYLAVPHRGQQRAAIRVYAVRP